MDNLPHFKISSSDKHFTLALEVEAALVECAVNTFVFTPAKPKMALTQTATVDFLSSWYGANVLRRSCSCPFYFRHACVSCRYNFMACTTQSFGFFWQAQNSTDKGGLPFLQLLGNL